MKRNVFLMALIGITLLCAGCSKTKPVKILSGPWAVGKHQDCVYQGEGIYCLPTTMTKFRQYNFEGFIDKDKKKLARTDGIFILGVDIVHYLQRNRAEAEKDPSAESGTFETSFSNPPSDYSLWDCYKTGNGSPAISCHLTKEADSKTHDFNAKKEAAARTDDVLLDLTAASLTKSCSTPQSASLDDLYQMFKYPSARAEVPITLKFENPSHGSNHLEYVETEEARGANGQYPKEHISWMRFNDSLYEAQKIGDQLACLKK
jgi:hypothetical protein